MYSDELLSTAVWTWRQGDTVYLETKDGMKWMLRTTRKYDWNRMTVFISASPSAYRIDEDGILISQNDRVLKMLQLAIWPLDTDDLG